MRLIALVVVTAVRPRRSEVLSRVWVSGALGGRGPLAEGPLAEDAAIRSPTGRPPPTPPLGDRGRVGDRDKPWIRRLDPVPARHSRLTHVAEAGVQLPTLT